MSIIKSFIKRYGFNKNDVIFILIVINVILLGSIIMGYMN